MHTQPQRTSKRSTFLIFSFSLGLTLSLALADRLPTETVQRWLAATVPHQEVVKDSFRNWGLYNSGRSHIDALKAWELEKGNRQVVVAVIDTGVDPNHPDLRENIWYSKNPKKGLPRLDSRGKVLAYHNAKKVFGYDFVRNSPNPMDSHGHGTHVAGLIGAVTNPKTGTGGVAQRVSIMAVRYYSDSNPGSVNLSNTIKAIEYAVENGAKIINYSGGGPEFSKKEKLAIRKAQAAGVLFVAAAGNERSNADLEENHYYPAAYGLKNILSVAATNRKNRLLGTSNWGTKNTHVAAPGENIESTLPNARYGTMSGTSQATAFVSGIAALLLSKDPTLTPGEVIGIIKKSVDPLRTLYGKVQTGGKVNAYRALQLLDKLQQDKRRRAGQDVAAYLPMGLGSLIHGH